MTPWGFYGRQHELAQLRSVLSRQRWFFVQIAGRRRIGKTSLIQQALAQTGRELVLYVQIPDSDPAGVVSACNDYLQTFGIDKRVSSLAGLAQLVSELVQQGYVVALDEFQYFNRKPLFDFCSFLQAEVDKLSARAESVRGGLIVLGSLHAEMSALLEDRVAPLFNRTTDVLELGHLDFASLADLLGTHADLEPERLLFLWSLFEGVPKFYRDAYEQGVLDADRQEMLKTLFFSSSSPLRGEADNWFLRELRGRYDTLLQYLARNPGRGNADITAALSAISEHEGKQAGGYLKVLTERYRMVERRLPIFASSKARTGRYYICDNFLRSWLMALQRPVSAIHFRPQEQLLGQADQLLAEAEGATLEEMAGRLYEEASRKAVGDFPLSERIKGYWDRSGVEIDLVAVSEEDRRIRFGSCKRNPEKLQPSVLALKTGADSFLKHHQRFADWRIEYCAIAPRISDQLAGELRANGVIPQSISTLLQPLLASSR
ncbi:MAG: ATP-binding protein [Rhodocyclaceae bacterium]|nr:ATP-binding protein [Azospira sp.]